MRAAVQCVSMRFLVDTKSVTDRVMSLIRAFLVCMIAVRRQGQLMVDLSKSGNDLSPCASALIKATTFLCVLYVMEPVDMDARDTRLVQVIAALRTSGAGASMVPRATVLRAIVAAATRSSASEHASAQFRVCHLDDHGLCGTVGGSEMNVAQVGAAALTLHAECHHLFDALMFDSDGIDSQWKRVPVGPVDRLDQTQRGSWWGNVAVKERAGTKAAKAWAGAALAERAHLDGPSSRLTAAGTSTLNAWIVNYHKFVGALLAGYLNLWWRTGARN
jgi:hypothetical protein